MAGLVAHLPVVAPWCGPQHPASVMYPSIDQRAGVRLLISHLVAHGHRRVLHLAGPAGWDGGDGGDGAALEPLLVVRSSVAAAPGG